jgi:hypothetical protein
MRRGDVFHRRTMFLAAVRSALLRIPTHAGHLFRDDVGHHSDLMPATVPR